MEKQRFIFDLDGTLLKPDYSYESEYFNRVLKEDEAKIVLSKISGLIDCYERNFDNYDIFSFSTFLSLECGVTITPEIILGWNEALKRAKPIIIDGVIDTLEYLKNKDKSIVVLSNWFYDSQKIRIEKCLGNYIDEVFGGDKFLKPQRESYLMSCGKYPLEECVMIGDDLEKDVYGALDIGMDAVYYNPKGYNSFDRNKVKSIGSMNLLKEMY